MALKGLPGAGTIKKRGLARKEDDDYESLAYFDFFNRFRSPSGIVKQRQLPFIKYFLGCGNVLSIGCGRGEFLELLRAQGIACTGIDVDDKMVEYCKKRGLNVLKADALSYLRGLDNESLDGIFTDDLVEHLETAYLFRMLRLCYRKLKPGRYLVNVTLNPLSWATYAGIYLLDPTHKRPIHPETMRFFLDSSGFNDVDIEFISSKSGSDRLKRIEITPEMGEEAREIARINNRNVDMLNVSIYGPENYAAIAKK